MSQLSQLLRGHMDKNGVTLYDHLNQFLFQLSQQTDNKYTKQLECFELLSDFLKKNRYIYSQPKSDHEVNQVKDVPANFAQWAATVEDLIKNQTQTAMPCMIQNFVNDARALEIAGIGFGEDESYRIQLSIKRLAVESSAIELCFWGKIITNGKDYYVAQGVTPPVPTDFLPINGEARGTGVNYYTFWVCHDILHDWLELPLVTPEQVIAARLSKHICTGNLDASLHTYPPFPGKEKHYLKAQIVRITHANQIVPKGLYRPNEEKPKEIEFEEEFKLPEFAEFSNLENWVHIPAQILKLGRISHFTDPALSDEAKNAELEILAEKDPEGERLRGIIEDTPYEVDLVNWSVKTAGDLQIFNPAKEDASVGVYGVTILRNYLWPGALTVAYRTSFVNFYVGYGLKINQPAFTPISPNDLQEEPEEIEEHHEPNPKNLPPPKIVNPDPDIVDDQQND